jgi:dTDP-4-amino-4,6-dideoxygalactose transaminase
VSGEGGTCCQRPVVCGARLDHSRKGEQPEPLLQGPGGQVAWLDIGSSYLPSKLIAALLYAQLPQLDAITADRLETWHVYHSALAPLEAGPAQAAADPARREPQCASLSRLLPPDVPREAKAEEVDAHFHYVPLHSSPAGRRYGLANCR